MINKRLPIVPVIITSICTLVFILQCVFHDQLETILGMFEGAVPLQSLSSIQDIFIGNDRNWLFNTNVYRIFTSAFIHFGILHFVCNMMALWGIAGYLENAIGWKKVTIIYFYGILGSSLFINFFGGDNHLHGGASGAIWALMVATLIYKYENRGDMLYITRYFVYNLLLTLFVPGISWQGHIGGALIALCVTPGMLKCKEAYWWGGVL